MGKLQQSLKIKKKKSDYVIVNDFKSESLKKKINIIPSLGIKIVKSQKKVLRKKSTNFLMISRIIKDKGIE